MKTTLFSESSCKGTLLSTRGGSISNLHKTGTKHPERDPNEKITSYSACPCTRSDPFHGLQQGRRGHSPPAGPRNGGPDHYVLSDRNQPGSYFRKNVDDAMNAIDRNILHNSRVLVFIQPQRGLSMVLELYYTPRNDDYVPGAQFSYEHCKVDTLRRWADADFNSMDRGTITEVISYMAEQAPARRYGLILGGHGLGWVPDGTSVNAIRFSAFQDFWSRCRMPCRPLDGRFRQAG